MVYKKKESREREREHQWYGEGWWCCSAGVCSTVQGGPLSVPTPLNPSHLPRPWIRHTPVCPARMPPARPPAAQSTLKPCHGCVPSAAVPLSSPVFTLFSCLWASSGAISCASGRTVSDWPPASTRLNKSVINLTSQLCPNQAHCMIWC